MSREQANCVDRIPAHTVSRTYQLIVAQTVERYDDWRITSSKGNVTKTPWRKLRYMVKLLRYITRRRIEEAKVHHHTLLPSALDGNAKTRYNLGVCLQDARKITNIDQNNRSQERDFNPYSSNYPLDRHGRSIYTVRQKQWPVSNIIATTL
jgi:hypothetical protein